MQRRENGMGTIYQRDNGTWGGRIKEKGKDGRTKYKCFSGKSQAEVKRKIREYNKQSDAVDPTEVSLETYMTDWLLNAKCDYLNKAKRQKLTDAVKYVKQALWIIQIVQDGEQDAFDNMPENLQTSYQCEKMESAIDSMDYASDHLEEAVQHMNRALELL